MKKLILPLFSVAALATPCHAAVMLAQYTFDGTDVTNSNKSNATAASVAPVATGLSVTAMTVVGGVNDQFSISSGTSTAYGRADKTPDIADIYSSTRYHTFTLTLTDAYTLQSLTFDTGGSNISGATANYAYGAQVQIGTSGFTNLATSSGSLTSAAGNYRSTGAYSESLGAAFENLDDTTVTFRIFLADDTNENAVAGRIKNVTVNGVAVPEPSTVALAALGMLGLLRRRR